MAACWRLICVMGVSLLFGVWWVALLLTHPMVMIFIKKLIKLSVYVDVGTRGVDGDALKHASITKMQESVLDAVDAALANT